MNWKMEEINVEDYFEGLRTLHHSFFKGGVDGKLFYSLGGLVYGIVGSFEDKSGGEFHGEKMFGTLEYGQDIRRIIMRQRGVIPGRHLHLHLGDREVKREYIKALEGIERQSREERDS